MRAADFDDKGHSLSFLGESKKTKGVSEHWRKKMYYLFPGGEFWGGRRKSTPGECAKTKTPCWGKTTIHSVGEH